MVRKFMQLEEAADALFPARPGCIAAGQRLAGSQVELWRQAAGIDFHRQAHSVVLTCGCTSNIRRAKTIARQRIWLTGPPPMSGVLTVEAPVTPREMPAKSARSSEPRPM